MSSKIKLWFLFLLILSVFVLDHTSSRKLDALAILSEVNSDRAEHNLPPLALNSTLSLAALSKAHDMVSQDYFAHISPEGVKPWHWFKVAGYDYVYAGENLAAGFSSASELQQSWMSSPQHRANILSPFYDELGLAVMTRNNKTIVVQFFGSRVNKVTLRQ